MKVQGFQAYVIDNKYTYDELKKNINITEKWEDISGKLPQILVQANIGEAGVEYATAKAYVTIGETNVNKNLSNDGLALLDLSAAASTYITSDITIKVYDSEPKTAQTVVIRGMSVDNAVAIVDKHLKTQGQIQLAKVLHALVILANKGGKDVVLPAATKEAIGAVKAADNITDLAGEAQLAEVVGKVNALLAALRTCGILI